MPMSWPTFADGACAIVATPLSAFTSLAGRTVKLTTTGALIWLPATSEMTAGSMVKR